MRRALTGSILATVAAANTVTIHKVDYPKKGACSSVGYSVADGQQTVTIPVWGKKVTFDLFKKAAAEAEGTVTIHKVDYPKEGDCGQTTVDAASAHWPEQFGKFVAGACSSAGYSVADGQQTVTIPVWGKKVTFDLFKKAAHAVSV